MNNPILLDSFPVVALTMKSKLPSPFIATLSSFYENSMSL